MPIQLKIGCDPEFFLSNKKRRWTSAHDLVPGNKKEPHKLEKGAIQADGTAVEFNIEPASTPEEFALNISTVLQQVRKHVPEEYKFEFRPSIIYNSDYFEQVPESAKELGCDPDFNAWKFGEQNPRPTPRPGHRTASGHIHLGWTEGADITDPQHLEDCMVITRRLDYLLSPITGLWETEHDHDRRDLYGSWGTFRPKPYGVEYRVLGNSWLKYPRLWPWLFKYVEYAFRTLEEGYGEDTQLLKPIAIDLSKAEHQYYDQKNHGTLKTAFFGNAVPREGSVNFGAKRSSIANNEINYITSNFRGMKPPIVTDDMLVTE